MIEAPFTEDQIESLNYYQQYANFHPFTCGTDSSHRDLIANRNGWFCLDCSYTQNWCHAFMADWSWFNDRDWFTVIRLPQEKVDEIRKKRESRLS